MTDFLSVPQTSRYKDTAVLQERDGIVHYGLFVVPQELQDAVDTQARTMTTAAHQVGRSDLLAHRFLNSEANHWTIAYINGWIDPVEDMVEGQPMKIPQSGPVLDFSSRAGI